MERSQGRYYTAVCLAGDHRDTYIHTMKPPEISPVYGTEIYPKKYEIETLMCLVSTTASSSAPSRPQHYIKQAERHLLCLTSSCLNNWMTAATYDKNSKSNKYMSTGRASPAE